MRIWSTEMLFENFQIFHNILLNFVKFRGANFEKHADPIKKNQNRRTRTNSRNRLEYFSRTHDFRELRVRGMVTAHVYK